MRPDEDGLGASGAGSDAGSGGSASSGGAMMSGGTGASTAGKGAQGGTAAQGSTGATGGTGIVPEGGSGNEAGEASEGGEDSGGKGGSAGSSSGGGGSGGTAGGSGGSAGKASTGGGGSGGSGGSAPGPKCSDHPLTAKATWTATGWPSSPGNGTEADPLYNPPSHMLDGSLNERWSTGRTQMGGEWLQLDFGQEVSLKQLVLMLLSENGGNGNDYPRGYEVRLSNAAPPKPDGVPDFTPAVRASGAGAPSSNLTLNFPTPISGRYLSVRQTGVITMGGGWWTVTEANASCVD